MSMSRSSAPLWRIIISFAAIYLMWGGSFLAIHLSQQSIPPFLISAVRFTLAGLVLMLVARRSGVSMPTRQQWRSAVILGLLMFVLANSSLMLGQRTVPSGLAATLYATLPLWVTLMTWLWLGEARPSLQIVVGLVLGFVGIVLLFGPSSGGTAGIDPMGGVLVLLSAIFWAAGSLLSQRVSLPASSTLSSGMNLFVSGLIFFLLSAVTGEFSRLDTATITGESLLAVLYLIVGSSVIAFSAYMWLLANISPSLVSTYAYVNPVVALFIGWLLNNEELTVMELVAAAVILVAIIILTTARGKAAERSGVESNSVRSRLRALTGRSRAV